MEHGASILRKIFQTFGFSSSALKEVTNFVITDFLYIIYGPLDGAKVKIIGPALGSLLLIIIASGLEEIFLFVL